MTQIATNGIVNPIGPLYLVKREGTEQMSREPAHAIEPAQAPHLALPFAPYYVTPFGQLYDGDCLDILPHVPGGIVDTVFADPPFNLGKTYGHRTNDSRADAEYLDWCKRWLAECIRILKPGG